MATVWRPGTRCNSLIFHGLSNLTQKEFKGLKTIAIEASFTGISVGIDRYSFYSTVVSLSCIAIIPKTRGRSGKVDREQPLIKTKTVSFIESPITKKREERAAPRWAWLLRIFQTFEWPSEYLRGVV